MKIDGAAAVVTGGTKGIGYGIAERLAQAGASVMICGRDRDELTAAVDKLSASGKAFGKLCDVRVEEQVKGLIAGLVNIPNRGIGHGVHAITGQLDRLAVLIIHDRIISIRRKFQRVRSQPVIVTAPF